ncbi:MAG: LysR family transcriptional regulator [Robiginitomaculum sp.]|nr:LysR family transcriptional regulator [Robiginitomaculum sp.]
MNLDIRHLRHFEAVYRLRSFVRAAKETSVTQSALTKSIKALENEIGAPLFDRTTHSVTPTKTGDILIRYAKDVISSLGLFEQQAASINDLDTGSLTLGSGPYPLEPLITTALRDFAKHFPSIHVTLQTGSSNALLERLMNRTLDLVVCDISKYQHGPFSDQIAVDVLPPEPIVLIHDRYHPLSGKTITLEKLAPYAWASPTASPGLFRRLPTELRQRAFPTGYAHYRVEVISACLEIVRGSTVLTAIPRSLARRVYENGNLIMRPLPGSFQTNDGIHTLAHKAKSPAVIAFIEHMTTTAKALAAERT